MLLCTGLIVIDVWKGQVPHKTKLKEWCHLKAKQSISQKYKKIDTLTIERDSTRVTYLSALSSFVFDIITTATKTFVSITPGWHDDNYLSSRVIAFFYVFLANCPTVDFRGSSLILIFKVLGWILIYINRYIIV